MFMWIILLCASAALFAIADQLRVRGPQYRANLPAVGIEICAMFALSLGFFLAGKQGLNENSFLAWLICVVAYLLALGISFLIARFVASRMH